jgi:hypothetical protein
MLRRAGLVSMIAALASGCGGGQQALAPAIGTDAALQTAMHTPKSISPALIPAQPMPQTPILPASTMMGLRPQSAIEPSSWKQLPGSAQEIAVSPDGSLWALAFQYFAPYGYAIYHYANGSWANIPGAATRLSVGPDDSLWAVNATGGIYHYSNGSWSAITGGASDISIGPDGSIYVISNVPGNAYGNGIYHYVSGTWTQLAGAGTTIAASWDTVTNAGFIAPGGYYVTNSFGSIFYHNPTSGYAQLPGAALEVAPTTSGGLYAIGDPASAGIYYNNLNVDSWTQEPGQATRIATNGTIVAVVNSAGGIYDSSVQVVAPSPSPSPSPTLAPIVTSPPGTPGISLNAVGATQPLTASEAGYSGSFTATSNGTTIATVSGTSPNFTVTAVAAGTTTITVSDTNGQSVAVSVTVTTTSIIAQ